MAHGAMLFRVFTFFPSEFRSRCSAHFFPNRHIEWGQDRAGRLFQPAALVLQAALVMRVALELLARLRRLNAVDSHQDWAA